MILRLEDLAVDCVIGDLPDERNRLQRLRVNVSLMVSDRAAETDELSDAVDYAALSARIRETLVRGKFHLIERAAKAVRTVCLAEKNALGATVSVTKAGAVPNLVAATAIIRDSSVCEGDLP